MTAFSTLSREGQFSFLLALSRIISMEVELTLALLVSGRISPYKSTSKSNREPSSRGKDNCNLKFLIEIPILLECAL